MWLFAVLWFSQEGPQFETKYGTILIDSARFLWICHLETTLRGCASISRACAGSVGLLSLMGLLGLTINVLYAGIGLILAYNPVIPSSLMLGCSGSMWVRGSCAVVAAIVLCLIFASRLLPLHPSSRSPSCSL